MRFLGRRKKAEDALTAKRTSRKSTGGVSADGDTDQEKGPWSKLEKAVRENVLFKVTSVDGMRWIDPFTGKMFDAPFGPVDVALDYYRNNPDVWRSGKPKSMAVIQYHRWQVYLKEELAQEERLRLFSNDRGWLNPFSGKWEAKVKQIGGRITPAVIAAMAKTLSKCEPAKSGKLMEKLKRAIAGKPVETAKLKLTTKKTTKMIPQNRYSAVMMRSMPRSCLTSRSISIKPHHRLPYQRPAPQLYPRPARSPLPHQRLVRAGNRANGGGGQWRHGASGTASTRNSWH